MIKRRELIRTTEPRDATELTASKKVALLKTKEFQPIKTADKKHHSVTKINKNFYPHLLNCTNDLNLKARVVKTSRGKIVITSFNLMEDAEYDQYAHLPTRPEFQILMGLLAIANKLGTPRIEFDSWNMLLTHLGLAENEEGRQKVRDALFVFMFLNLNFQDSYLEPDKNNPQQLKITERNKVMHILSEFTSIKTEVKGCKKSTKIFIEFDTKFFDECNFNRFIQKVDVTKIMQFRSPHALSIYLYLLKWCKVGKVESMRKHSERIDFLYNYLGWKKPVALLANKLPNPEAYPSQVKKLINKALEQIMEIDERFNIELDNEEFEEGRIQFNLLPVQLKNPKVEAIKQKPYAELTIEEIMQLPRESEWLERLGYDETDAAFIKVSQELKRKV